ncbi:MAG: hypothetical protein KDA78_04920 [Planctomycetaceae bacterium]|nr:hypothetical protein [Planctomycetaceae bacterium]
MASLTGEFLCPTCGARLRVQQDGIPVLDFTCPECRTLLQIHVGPDQQLKADLSPETKVESSSFSIPQRRKVALVAFGILMTGLIVLVSWLLNRDTQRIAKQNNQPVEPAGTSEVAPAAGTSENGNDSPNPPQAKIDPNSFQGRLLQLGTRIGLFRSRQAAFPAAQAEGNQPALSWVALLDQQEFPNAQPGPHLNLEWDASANDTYVRRSRPELLNPALKQTAGADRYPTAHFVGIAGVGHDAPDLPVTHPRAGIFARNRSTRVEDVKDGLSQTWMISGIVSQFTSWADGEHMIRPLTKAPYINGPDGFGSDSPDQMLILMADGSVRSVSSETSEVILRRMAAIADGYSLDPSVPGDPAGNVVEPESPINSSTPIPVPVMPDPVRSSEPATTSQVPPEEMVDFPKVVEKAFAQKIVSFELNQPTPLAQVLAELEAIAGVRIEFDPTAYPAESPARMQPVKLSGKNSTLGELLKNLLEPLGIRWTLRDQKVILIPID